MAVIPIYNAFHSVLKQPTKHVIELNDEIETLIDDLFETLHNISNGVGLAANQIGKDKSVVVIDTSIAEGEINPEIIVMINPEILEYSDEETEEQEGCLSVPELYEKVQRPIEIKVKYFDSEMKEHIREVGGFLARVMQHEIDHLNGKLFFERLSPLRRALVKNKLKKIKRGAIVPDYPMVQADGTLTK